MSTSTTAQYGYDVKQTNFFHFFLASQVSYIQFISDIIGCNFKNGLHVCENELCGQNKDDRRTETGKRNSIDF